MKNLRDFATERQLELLDAVEKYGSQRAAAAGLGISRGTIGNALASLSRKVAKGSVIAPLISSTLGPMSEDQKKYRGDWTSQDCIDELVRIAKIDETKVITRNYFRVHSEISESTWNRHFGTFLEFKRQANITLSRHAHGLERAIAKHASKDPQRKMNAEKAGWEDKYLRPSGKRFQTVLVCSDVHDIECDPFWRRCFVDTAKRVQPEKLVFNGDIFDLPEFGKYGVDPREWDVVGRIRWVHIFMADLREVCPDAEFIFVEGNHECVEESTLVLTKRGWVTAELVGFSDEIASVRLDNKSISYAPPIAIDYLNADLVRLTGEFHDELVSENHNIVVDGALRKVSDFVGSAIPSTAFWYVGSGGIISTSRRIDGPYVRVGKAGRGNVVAIQTIDGTLITKREGKPVVTGNCRLIRHLSEATPALKAVLSDLHGFTVPKLLGLEDYHINYIARVDLAAFSERDLKQELGKNYHIMYDCFLTHHFPEGRNLGYPGVNGHHHRFFAWTQYSPQFGSYAWIQAGAGHRRAATYCSAEKWNTGFLLAHIDTQKKSVQMEYIDVRDHAMIGGRFYQRTPEEA